MDRGHAVTQLLVNNGELRHASIPQRIGSAMRAVWNARALAMLQHHVDRVRPDVMHVHNTFAMLSPSIYWVAQRMPIVTTLHNYRSTCANGLLMRAGNPCSECVGKLPWPAIQHGCRYANSSGAGAIIALTQAVHFRLGTYARKVSAHIVLTEWQKQVMVKAGLPAERIHVKPNFTCPPAAAVAAVPRKAQILFAGQLGSAKGVDLLLDAWNRIPHYGHRLVFAGRDTCGEGMPERIAQTLDSEWIGCIPRPQLMREIAASRWLVLPSRWYEGLPMVLIEAKSLATPGIGPSHGSFVEVIRPGVDGLRCAPCDPAALAGALRQALETSPAGWLRLSESALADHRARYSPAANYDILMRIYESVLEKRRASAPALDGAERGEMATAVD